MNAQITPSVGRKVWFFEHGSQVEPHDATIIKVWSNPAYPNTAVNLLVTDPYSGAQTLRTSIAVGDESTSWPHYRWMPYQQAQAAKESQHPAVAAASPVGGVVQNF